MRGLTLNPKGLALHFQIILVALTRSVAEAAVNGNAIEFGAMCKLVNIIRTGLNDPKKYEFKTHKFEEELQELNESLRRIPIVGNESESRVGPDTQEAVNREPGTQLARSYGRPSKIAIQNFKRITTRAYSLANSIQSELNQQSQAKNEVKRQLEAALFGEAGLSGVKASKSYHGTAATACGNNGGPRDPLGPGTSLAGDMLCLCTRSNSEAICADGVTMNVASNFGDDLSSQWGTIVTKCEKSSEGAFSGSELSMARVGVLSLLGKHAAAGSADAMRFVLGTGTSGGGSPGCAGTSVACVNYGTSSGAKLNDIPWATSIQAAVSGLEQAENREREISEKLSELRLLVHLAGVAGNQWYPSSIGGFGSQTERPNGMQKSVKGEVDQAAPSLASSQAGTPNRVERTGLGTAPELFIYYTLVLA